MSSASSDRGSPGFMGVLATVSFSDFSGRSAATLARMAKSARPPRFQAALRVALALAALLSCIAAKSAIGGNATGTVDTPKEGDFRNAQTYVDAHNAVRAAVKEPRDYPGAWAPLAQLA